MNDAISSARTTIRDRVERHPTSFTYAFAAHEMARIDERLAQGPRIDHAFYGTLNHGLRLMCARELEASDMPFCDDIYAMLTEIQGMENRRRHRPTYGDWKSERSPDSDIWPQTNAFPHQEHA
jgi:hypothetical protein